MTTRTKWGVPRSAEYPQLRDLTYRFPGEKIFEQSESLTVKLKAVEVLEDEDKDFLFIPNNNDIIIVTSYRFNTEPPVIRLHYMKKGVELGRIVPAFQDVVFSLDGLKEEYKILTLKIQTYDVDGMDDDTVNAISNLAEDVAKAASVFFPQISLIAAGIAFAIPPLLKLINNLNEHDKVIDDSFQFEIGEPGERNELLQPGYFVCFKRPQPEGLTLDSSLKVIKQDSSEFRDCSYAVFEVCRSYLPPTSTWLIDQKMAKIISELDGKGQSGKDSIVFLRETLQAYTKWQNLNRAKHISAKTEGERTNGERNLLKILLEDPEIKSLIPGV